MRKRPIVIIGGMGPQASHAFHGRLLSRSRRFHDGSPDNFPQITHLSLQIPEFFDDSRNEDKAVGIINSQLAVLDLGPETIVCMPCNTAHKLLDRLNLGEAEFVSMVEAVETKLRQLSVQRIGLLASPNTLNSGFYHKLLDNAGKQPVCPTEQGSKTLRDIIAAVISEVSTKAARRNLNRLAAELENDGAEAILLGCTELSVLGIETNLTVVDSLDELCDAVLSTMLI